MDPRSTWYQPEQLGPATELWTNIFNSATRSLRDLQMGDGKSANSDGNGLHDNDARTRTLTPRDTQDFIPLNGDTGVDLATKRSAVNHGFQNGERTNLSSNNLFNKRRKDNLACTYDWNSSGKVRYGGTPWWSRQTVGNQLVSPYPDLTNHNVGLGLSREIDDFFCFMFPRVEEHLMRSEVVQRIEGIVKNIWPEARVEIYGSYRTMLYLPTSDIDLVVFGDLGDCPFFRIGNELEKSHIAEMGSIKVLDKASVPIVKLTDDQTKVKVDISFNMRSGIACAKLIEDFIKQFPCLPHLVFVLKQFLLQRELNEVWTGGISSYSLILMAVSFLQMHVQPEPTNLGVQLIEFFELYGVNFNYFKTGISVMDRGYYFSKDDARGKMGQGYGTSLLCIEDPLNPGTDICKNSYGFMEVRNAFRYAYSVLKQALLNQLDQEECTDSILGRIIRITDDVIEYRHWIQRNWAHKVRQPMPFPSYITHFPPPTHMVSRYWAGNAAVPVMNATMNFSLDNTVDNSVDERGGEATEDTSNANTDVGLIGQGGTESESLQSSISTPDALSSASDTDSDLSSHVSGSSKESRDNSPDLRKPADSAPIVPSTEEATQSQPQSNEDTIKKVEVPNPVKEKESRTVNTINVSNQPASEPKPQKEEAPAKMMTTPKEKITGKEDVGKQSPATQQQLHRTTPNMVTSKTYRNSNHQHNYQQGSKFRSSSAGGSSSSHGGSSGIHTSSSNVHQSSGTNASSSSSRGSNNNNNVSSKKCKKKTKRDANSNSVR
ncbi:non-canonical poly(A) RNA polymerase PAPD7-like [Acanthaster planci]|uniref:polynucleotide adenylyltransferase n=1 Tax=Acanthaster planci TaxID=133434 RepID=A0A8B7YI49_ACAPL|nr:non-canonical poly(A) RNA polymerase PAPD7-like [Acanthaster planci]